MLSRVGVPVARRIPPLRKLLYSYVGIAAPGHDTTNRNTLYRVSIGVFGDMTNLFKPLRKEKVLAHLPRDHLYVLDQIQIIRDVNGQEFEAAISLRPLSYQ